MKRIFLMLVGSLAISIGGDIQAQNSAPPFIDYPYLQGDSDFYAEFFAGGNFLQTETHRGIKTNYRGGYLLSASLGYQWANGLRLEGEYGFRKNSMKSVHFFGHSFRISGHAQSSSGMANLVWNIPFFSCDSRFWYVRPFLGGGVGYDYQHIHGKNELLTVNARTSGFAWQAMAGLIYSIYPVIEISAEYRCHQGSINYIYNHSVGFGLTYRL